MTAPSATFPSGTPVATPNYLVQVASGVPATTVFPAGTPLAEPIYLVDSNGNPYQFSQTVFAVADYGAVSGDNTSNKVPNTRAVTLAIAAAVAAGGGIVFFGPGYWVTKNTDFSTASGVTFMGCGPGATVWKLADGENTDLLSAYVANINLTGTAGTGPSTAVANFCIRDITLDGNYLNQSGTSYVLRYYGYAEYFDNIRIINGLSGGIQRDWYGPFPSSHIVEYKWNNFEILDNQGISVEVGGPSDSQWNNGVIANNANVGSHLVHTCTNSSGLQCENVHLYRPSPFTYSSCLIVEGASSWVNCEAEGSDTVNIVVLNDRFQWNGGRIFQGGRNCSGIQIGQKATLALATGAVASPITLTTPIAQCNYAAFLSFVVTGAGGSGSFSLSGVDQNNTVASETLPATGNGTFQSVNAYSGTPTITWTGLAGATITVNAVGKAYASVTSAHASAGLTTSFAPKNYTVKAHLHDHANYGIIFSNDVNGGGDIDCSIQQTTGSSLLATPGVNTKCFINERGLTSDGTIATSGMFNFPVKANLGFQVTDGTNALLNYDTQNKRFQFLQDTAIWQYGGNFTTLKTRLEAGTICLFPSTTSPATGSNGTITTSGVGIARITPAANITGVIMQAGTIAGQHCEVENQSAFWVQMAASGTSNVASGTSDYIAPNASALYEWDTGNSLWYRVDPPYAVQPLALYDGELATGSAAAGTANEAYFVGTELRTPVILTGIRVMFGTGGSGHYDVGIYSDVNGAPSTLLSHAASSSTALATATGIRTPALIGGNLTLFPGRYWLALWVDNGTDTIIRTAQAASIQINTQGSTTGPLPNSYSSLSVIQNSGLKPIILGIIQNGFS